MVMYVQVEVWRSRVTKKQGLMVNRHRTSAGLETQSESGVSTHQRKPPDAKSHSSLLECSN